MEGAAGVGVEDAAGVGGAGGGRGGRRRQRRARGVGGGRRGLGLALGDAAVADLPGLLLQGRGVPHGARPWVGGPDARGLQGVAVLLGLQ